MTELEELRAQVAAMRAALQAEEEAYQLYRAAAMLAPGAELRAMRERWRQATHQAAALRRRGLEATRGHEGTQGDAGGRKKVPGKYRYLVGNLSFPREENA